MQKKIEKCPRCGGDSLKVIFYGMPGYLCKNEDCSCGWGFAFWVEKVLGLPYNGYMMVYDGNYFRALWDWVVGN